MKTVLQNYYGLSKISSRLKVQACQKRVVKVQNVSVVHTFRDPDTLVIYQNVQII